MAAPRDMTAIGTGAIAAVMGAVFTLQGLGVVSLGEEANAPPAVVIAAGGVFLLGGVAVAVKGAAPQARLSDRLGEICAVLVLGGLASIATWIALAGDPRAFGGTLTGVPFHVTIARFVFGFGALLTWLAAAAFAWRAVSRLWRR